MIKKLEKLDNMGKRFSKLEKSSGNVEVDMIKKENEIEHGMKQINKIFEEI